MAIFEIELKNRDGTTVRARPRWVFNLWCLGTGDEICAADMGLLVSWPRRIFWRIRGFILHLLFGWWWWEEIE